MVKKWNDFHGIVEGEKPDDNTQLFGTGPSTQQDLVILLRKFVVFISKANPNSQEEFDDIKNDIREKKEAITRHVDYEEFKRFGFEYQDQIIKASDREEELREAVLSLYAKATKKGFI
tara:strand:+ start:4954 stop:5307 length:354 start_codon:yes stop_codon:yes gene_type:complete